MGKIQLNNGDKNRRPSHGFRRHRDSSGRPGRRGQGRHTKHLTMVGTTEHAARAALLATPIEELDLTVRSYNCLKRDGVRNVGELIGRTEQELLDIRNFGQKSVDEVKMKLAILDSSLTLKAPAIAA